MENGKQGAFACASDGCHQPGLTKREYFAGLAMQGIIASCGNAPLDITIIAELTAEEAVLISEALLKKLDGLKSE